MKFTLPNGILLGVSTAATQIEGGDVNSNWNDWYAQGRITDHTDPATGNDHWIQWQQDTALMAQMGLQAQYNVEQTVAYKPETDWNFEAGAHLSLLDHRLSADMSLFWILIEEQQVTMFPEGSITGRIMTNAGRSRSRGVELSLSWADRSGWFARASYGFTDARFTRFNNGRADYSGKRMPYAPSNTLFVGAGYSHKLKGFIDHIEAEINTRGTGSIQWDEANTVSQPFYMLLNASIKLSHRHIGLELWANNITATQYDTFYFVSIGNAFLQHGNGFSIGATASYRFDFP